MKRHVIVKASSLFRILLFSGGIPMRQQLATFCAWSAVSLTLAAFPLAPLHAEEASKPPVKVELSREERIEQALDRPCELAFDDKPLEEAVRELEKHYGFAVRLDNKSLMEAGVAYETPVNLMKSSSLDGALRQMLAPHELTIGIRHEALMVTTLGAAEFHLEVHVYPICDLVATEAKDDLRRYETLVDAITALIATADWGSVGGTGVMVAYPNAGALVASQTRETHRNIRLFLSALRESQQSSTMKDGSVDMFDNIANHHWVVRAGFVNPKHHGIDIDKRRGKARMKIEEALNAEGTRLVEEASLDDFMNEISTACKVRIVLDQKALMEAGVQSDVPTVRVNLKHLSYRSALEFVLDEHDLTWIIADDLLVITTKVEAEARQDARLYSVADLVVIPGATGDCLPQHDYWALIDMISSTIRPTTWPAVGGPAQLYPIEHLGQLTFLQTRDVHEQIEQLLAMLREVKARQFPEGKLEPMPEKAGDGLVLRVYEVSAKPKVVGGGSGGGFFNFDDKQPAAATGTPAEKPKADAAKPPENAKCEAPATPTVNPDHALAEQLVTAIPELIEPKSWQAGGGPGKIFAVGPRLLVRQTCDVHAQIKDLLKAIGQ